MSLYQPKVLQHLLQQLHSQPKRSLSQNFLIDGNIVRKILLLASVNPGDVILEVGPGPGVLTEALLGAGARVIAIEKDTAFADALMRWQHPLLTVYKEDALNVDLAALLPKGQLTKLVANLPYHITTPLLEKCLTASKGFSQFVVMVQKEVGVKLSIATDRGASCPLQLFMHLVGKPQIGFFVSKNSFYPPPKVDSCVMEVRLKEDIPVGIEPFLNVVKTAFQQKRKMLSSSLKGGFSKEMLDGLLAPFKKNHQARPEELSLEAWVVLAQALLFKG